MPTVAIVGGAGFVGTTIARRLSGTFKVRVIDINKPKAFCDEFYQVDIKDYNGIKKALNNVDVVIHTAIIQIPRINDEKKIGYEVNIVGTQNICEAVSEIDSIRGMILAGSWHVIGESGLSGEIDEAFGYRPDRVEDRARLYVLSKIAQEVIVRYFDEMDRKVYGEIRLGTVLGEGMPEKTAASIFIDRGLRGEPITPFKHSMYRPMLYVDARDVAEAFYRYTVKIVSGEVKKDDKRGSLSHIINLFYPEPITILELAQLVRNTIVELTNGKIQPEIQVIDQGVAPLFNEDSKRMFKVNISKAKQFLELERLISPKESIRELIKLRLERGTQRAST